MKKNSHKKGFTLIELLIAITIFMGFMIVASNAYLEIIRAQKTANETRLIYSELRNFVDLINNELREGTVDYFCYSQELLENLDFNQLALTRCYDAALLTVDAGNNLRTISRDGLSSSIIKFVPAAEEGQGGKLCQMRFRNSNGSWQREAGFEGGDSSDASGCGDYKELAFGNLDIRHLRMEIFPLKDPKSPSAQKDLENQIQPMVRMKLEVGSKLPSVKFDLNFQTSITARN
jgi:type II secretory pathway pseudopilin PulG